MGLLREWFGPSTAEIWRQLSAKIGAHFIEGGTWRPDRVEAKFKEWTITLDTYQEPVGRATVTYTRIRAPYVNKDGFRFTIYRRNLFSNLAKHLGMQDLEVGDRVVVAGHSEVDLAIVGKDRHRDTQLSGQRHEGERLDEPAASHVQRQLGAGHVGGDRVEVAQRGLRA